MYRDKIKEIHQNKNLSNKISDKVSDFVGSWRFIVFQLAFYTIWIIINSIGIYNKLDPFPFVFMNLVLAIETAFVSPLVMMSQNRQESKDRIRDDADFEADLKAEHNVLLLKKEVNELKAQIQELSIFLKSTK